MGDESISSATFHVLDYVVFTVFLLISLLIGILFAIQSFLRRRRARYVRQDDLNGFVPGANGEASLSGDASGETNEFLLGNRKMPMLPVSLSILASFISANTVMGNPGVVYEYGVIYFFFCLHNLISIPFAAHVFIPIFHDLRLTSVYEYLQLRFSLAVRLAAASIFVIQMLFYMAVVLYSPAIALQAVTGIDARISVVTTGLVCTVYTVMGGLKAVVWTDVFQMVVVYAGLIVMVVRGATLFEGVEEIWQTAVNGSRINLDQYSQYSLDPTVEYTYFSTIIGGAFTALTVYVSNQALVQRYLSLPSKRQAQTALYINGPLLIIIVGITSFLGLVIFKRYEDCDPLSTGVFNASDELMAAMIPTTLDFVPGLSGLFVACVFSASISTLSSGVNSLAAICVEDFMKPLLNSLSTSALSDAKTLRTSRILAAIFGLLTIGFAFLVDKIGSSVVVLALTVFGLCGGPLLGLFVQGVLCPWIDAAGAFFGVLASFSTLLFIKIGSLWSKYRPPTLSPSTKNCSYIFPNISSAQPPVTTTTANLTDGVVTSDVFPLFRVSFLWYALIAVVVAVVVGSFVSIIVDLFRPRPRGKIPSNLVAPIWRGSKFTRTPAVRNVVIGRENDAVEEEDTKL